MRHRSLPALESLESRSLPGSLGFAWEQQLPLPLLVAAGQIHPPPADTLPIAAGRRVRINLPKADVVIIAKDKDGQPSRFLDLAHDVWPTGVPQDSRGVQSIIDDVGDAYTKKGKPVDVILVASTTSGNSGFIVGRSYFFASSDPTQQLLTGCQGKVASLTLVASDAEGKGPLLQKLANGLSTATTLVRVTSYTGPVGVVPGDPGQAFFTMVQGQQVATFTPR